MAFQLFYKNVKNNTNYFTVSKTVIWSRETPDIYILLLFLTVYGYKWWGNMLCFPVWPYDKVVKSKPMSNFGLGKYAKSKCHHLCVANLL